MSNKWNKRLIKLKGFLRQVYSFLLLRYTSLNLKYLYHQIKSLSVTRLHIGCGDILVKGWLNIRYEKREEYGRIKQENDALLLNYNLLKCWPIDENSIEYVAASHFIEHLDLNKGIDFLRKCYGVIQRGGIIRLSCPDLELYAQKYVERNKDFYQHKLIKQWCTFDKAETPGEIFAAKAYDSGNSHQWFYDYDSLKHVLELVGFKEVRRISRLEGQTPDLDKIELPERELETVYVEAVKQ